LPDQAPADTPAPGRYSGVFLAAGCAFPDDKDKAGAVLKAVRTLKKNDFNVKPRSLLPPEDRAYYRENRLAYLEYCLTKI